MPRSDNDKPVVLEYQRSLPGRAFLVVFSSGIIVFATLLLPLIMFGLLMLLLVRGLW